MSESFSAMDHAVDLGMHPNPEKPQYVQSVVKFVCPHGCGFEELSSRYIGLSYWENAAKWHVEEECPFREPPTANGLLEQAARLLNDAYPGLTEDTAARAGQEHVEDEHDGVGEHTLCRCFTTYKRLDRRKSHPDTEGGD